MRTSESISWALVAASAILSALLWRELRAERQLVAELQAQPQKATVVVHEANCPVQPAVAAAVPADCPAVPPNADLGAASTVTPQQTSLIKAKFDELAEGKRASSLMQQRLTDSQPGAPGGK